MMMYIVPLSPKNNNSQGKFLAMALLTNVAVVVEYAAQLNGCQFVFQN